MCMASCRKKYNKYKKHIAFEIRVFRGYDENGKQIQPYTKTWKLPEAWWIWSEKKQNKELNKVIANFENECKTGEIKTKKELKVERAKQAKLEAERIEAEAKKLSVSDAFEKFLIKNQDDKKRNTITGYKTTMKRFIEFSENKKIENITKEDCQSYIDYLKKCGIEVSTIRKHYATLSGFLNWCVSEKLISNSPLAGITKPKDTRPKKVAQFFTEEEIQKIIKCAENEPIKWKLLINLMAESGMRRGEIVALRWEDVSNNDFKIQVVNNAQYTEYDGSYDTTTKSGESREVYVSKRIIDLLKEWKELQFKVAREMGLPDPIFIFTHLDSGERINPQAPTAYLRRFGKKYGIADCHPHKFRHTVATLMIKNGVNVKTVSEILGHSCIEITLKLYVHSDKDAQQKANEKLVSVMRK